MRNVEPNVESRTPFQSILIALRDEKQDFPRALLTRFSDLDPASLKALLEVWPQLSVSRKKQLLTGLHALMETDTLVSFEVIGQALLGDAEPALRAGALRLLAESDDPKLVPVFIKILRMDKDAATRLVTASLLGEFVMLGELEELPPEQHHASEEALLAVTGEDEVPALQRGALEALGYSSRLEVQSLIESAFRRRDPEWIASSLVAMGRSSDERWEPDVLTMLLNENNRIRLAAVEASGLLSLDAASPILLRLLEDEEDEQVTAAAVWSLSQIGGEEARLYLQTLLDQATDPDQIEYLEEALDNLSFTDELNRFDLLAYNAEEEDIE